MPFDPKPLQEFIEEGDRASPLIFAGRADEIECAKAALRSVERGRLAGQTALFTGAPGAGKTALLEHLKEDFERNGLAVAARLPVELIERPTDAIGAVVMQIDPEIAKKARQEITTTYGGGISSVISAGAERSKKDAGMSAMPTFATILPLLKKRLNGKPVVLFLDEAQDAVGDRPNGTNSLIQELHKGHSGPFLLIAGGLSDSKSVFKQIGISRFGRNRLHALGLLSGAEVREAAEDFLANEEYGIDCGPPAIRQQWVEALADESKGWPQHLTNAFCGAAEEIIKADGSLGNANLAAALKSSREYRESYYKARIEGVPLKLIADIYAAMPDSGGLGYDEIGKVIDRAYRSRSGMSGRLPQEKAFDELLHRGVLQDCMPERFDAPIPSLRKYVFALAKHNGWQPLSSDSGAR